MRAATRSRPVCEYRQDGVSHMNKDQNGQEADSGQLPQEGDLASLEAATGAETQADRVRQFRKMLVSGQTFMLPETHDVASATVLGDAGFAAVGTSAQAIAWAEGHRTEGHVGLAQLRDSAVRIARRTGLLVTADLGVASNYTIDELKAATQAVVQAGAVGISISDRMRNGHSRLLPAADMVARIAAVKEAAKQAAGVRVVVTVRTDAMVLGPVEKSAFETVIERAEDYFDTGIDCLLVPGAEHEQVVMRLAAIIDGPLAIRLSLNTACDLKTFSDAGACCIMLGPSLMRYWLSQLRLKAEELLAFGCFSHLDKAIPEVEIESLLPEEKG